MYELDLTRIFVKVVQHNGFSKAAEILGMPKSTVSKAISRLEKETGTKLLIRSTRSLTVTPAGRSFYEASLGPVTQLEDARKSLSGRDSILTGLVRITAPEDLGIFVVTPAIAELSLRYPELKFELTYTDERLDLVKDGFDLAVRIGKIRDSNLKLKSAGEFDLVAVASPKYLKNKAKIRQPKDINEHVCLSMDFKEILNQWTLRSGKSVTRIPVQPKIICNQMSSVLRMTLAGAGIALIPDYLCRPYVEKEELVRILPDWSSPGLPVSIISPLAPSSSARLKATVDHLLAALKTATNG